MDGDIDGWYAFACHYLAAPEGIRRKVSRQTLAHYRRIRRLPQNVGKDLDLRGTPLFVMRWIAWGDCAPARQQRYAVAVEYRERRGCWPPWNQLNKFCDGPSPDADLARFHELLKASVGTKDPVRALGH